MQIPFESNAYAKNINNWRFTFSNGEKKNCIKMQEKVGNLCSPQKTKFLYDIKRE